MSKFNYDENDEILRYRKKSIKSSKKSNHKHIYENVIGEIYFSPTSLPRYIPAFECTICNKVIISSFLDSGLSATFQKLPNMRIVKIKY